MRDRSNQKQFRYYWGSGKDIKEDYWTKHFCAAHHREFRPKILTNTKEVDALRASHGKPPHQFRANSRVC